MITASFYGVTGKKHKINTRVLSDFKMESKNHTQKIGYLPELRQTFIDDEIALF
jgi:hypothetical protein